LAQGFPWRTARHNGFATTIPDNLSTTIPKRLPVNIRYIATFLETPALFHTTPYFSSKFRQLADLLHHDHFAFSLAFLGAPIGSFYITTGFEHLA
jgi:hypothetical protein